jgi:hypothetical protein
MKPKKYARERAACSHCKRVFSAYVPAGGDGSLLVSGFHHGPTTFDSKRCPGVGLPVVEGTRQ